MMRYAFSPVVAVLLLVPAGLPAQELAPLRTAVDGTFAPHAFPSLSGGYQGFNIDLANEIATAYWHCTFVNDDGIMIEVASDRCS